jgi:uncharacterized protein (DUF488 family)
MILRTVGHGNRSAEELIDLLKDAGVSYVVDIRSIPYSVRFPHFGSRALKNSLRKAGIDYVYMGDLLGGKPLPHEEAEDTQWKQGHLDARLVASLRRTTRWREGLRKLAALVKDRAGAHEVGCLLCSEFDPARCHRSAVALELAGEVPGLEVSHLISSGRQPREEVGVQEPLM